MRCAACGAAMRSARVATLVGDGPARRAKVCRGCEALGVLVVPVRRPVVVDTDGAAKREAREVLAPFVRNLTAILAAAKATRGGRVDEDGKPYMEEPGSFQDGRIAALEAAVALLKETRT